MIEAFSVYAVAFLCRPVSGLLLGLLGDKWGRKNTITVALLMMGFATLLAGATPGYATIGIMSPVLLCISRMAQGLSVGAQSTGTFLLVLEKSPYAQHGLLTAMLIASQLSGFVLGGFVPAVMRMYISPEGMRLWGWRLALWVGLIPCVVTIMTHKDVKDEYVRRHVAGERDSNVTPDGGASMQDTSLKLDLVGIFFAFLSYVGGALVFYLNMVWFPVYLQAATGPAAGLAGTLSVAVFALILIPIAGISIDYLNPYFTGMLARFSNCILALPLTWWVLSEPSIYRYACAMTLMLPILSYDFVTTTKMLVPYFPAEGRYVSMAIAQNAGVGLTGGTAPMLAQWLTTKSNGNLLLGGYISVAMCISAFAVMALWCRPRCNFPGGPHDKKDRNYYTSLGDGPIDVTIPDDTGKKPTRSNTLSDSLRGYQAS
mmetsp:Transcript_11735/g.28917  ORF Transcript_11735/g.28917 Transcript_11735/m.28917 type:complete len:429 (-) Transcript_11735:206-1492(-)